jgi:hypothetical protein
MKLQVTQENLNRALNAVARVANSRGTLPILANVLIKTTNNRLSLSATNRAQRNQASRNHTPIPVGCEWNCRRRLPGHAGYQQRQ